MSIKRSTHTWLKPLYDNLDGISKNPFGVATSVHGFYGTTGIEQLATGTAGITGLTGAGGMTAFSMLWINGGSGAYYTLSDIVCQLKNIGVLKR